MAQTPKLFSARKLQEQMSQSQEFLRSSHAECVFCALESYDCRTPKSIKHCFGEEITGKEATVPEEESCIAVLMEIEHKRTKADKTTVLIPR
jgi:predicted RNase H-like nuclease